jgi:hypothetical protein
MGLISKLKGSDIDANEVLKELREFNEKVRGLDSLGDVVQLTEEQERLKKAISGMEIEIAQREEEYARKEREIEHKIGLEKKRAEFEREEAEKNARLAVREENLEAEKTRTKEQLDFITKRMEQELDSNRAMMEKVMQFIPTVNVDRRIRENYDQPPALNPGEYADTYEGNEPEPKPKKK